MSRQHGELPPEITVILDVKVDNKPLGALGDGEAVWHSDMTYNQHPPRGACLRAQGDSARRRQHLFRQPRRGL